MKIKARPYLLVNPIQPYAWGSRGRDALIPRLLGLTPEPDQPYAELWIGAHPKAPSAIVTPEGERPLDAWIAQDPAAALGPAVAARFEGRLPFLLKILSAAQPLSIQAHPNRAQAAALHARDPEHYPDPNHKPEVAIALDRLDALVGFKPVAEINAALQMYPALAAFSGVVAPIADVRALYPVLLNRAVAEPEALQSALEQLTRRLEREPQPTPTEALFLELRERYPGPDVGLLSIFLLNWVHLEAGEGLFTGPGIPHAYLRGNIVECMANSDNVVRVGLTRKYTDVAALAETLTYESGPVAKLGEASAPGRMRYPLPIEEFAIERWQLRRGEMAPIVTGGSLRVVLVTAGEVACSWEKAGQMQQLGVSQGRAVFVPATLRRFQLTALDAATLFYVSVPDASSSASS